MDLSAPYRLGKIPFMILRLEHIQRLNAKELRDRQNKRLRAIIRHSFYHVPYYHSLFKNVNLKPDDIKTAEDLHKIPVSKKKDMRHLPIKDVTADNVDLNTCEARRTSGTSGIPFTIYRDKKNLLLHYLSNYLWQLKCGDKITNKRVILQDSNTSPLPPWVQKLGIFRTKKISIFNHPQTQLKEIKEYDARTMLGVPSSFASLAKEIVESNYEGLKLDLIFTSGEFLHEKTRSFIDVTFNANHFRAYGATEADAIGRECLQHHYHISDTVLVEMTRDGETVSTGEEGEVTITNLNEYAQPFIRYNLEDMGKLLGDDCSCGSHFPLIKPTWGRMSDFIYLPDGRAISAHQANTFLLFMKEIKQYQVIQETINHLTVKLVKAKGLQERTLSEIKQAYNKILGDELEIDVIIVDDIQRDKSGKFKLFKTNIPTT